MKHILSILFVVLFFVGCGGGGGIAGIDTIQGIKDAWNDLIGNSTSSLSSSQQLSNDAWKIAPNDAPKIAVNIGGTRYSNYVITDSIYVGDTKTLSIDYLSNSQTPAITYASTKGLTIVGFDPVAKKLSISAIKDGNETVEVAIKDTNGTAKATILLEVKKSPIASSSSSASTGTIHPNIPLATDGKPRIAIKAVDSSGKDFYYEDTYYVPGKVSLNQKIVLDFVYSTKSDTPQIKAVAKSKLANTSTNVTNKQLSIEMLKEGTETVELSITDDKGSAKLSIILSATVSSTQSGTGSTTSSAQSGTGSTTGSAQSSAGGTTSSAQSSANSSQTTDSKPYFFPNAFKPKTDLDLNAICISDEVKVQAIADGLIMQASGGVIIKNDKEEGDAVSIKKDDRIKLKLVTGGNYYKDYNMSVEVGNSKYSFGCKTKFVKMTEPNDFELNSVQSAKLDTVYESNEIVVSGVTVKVQASIDNGELILNGTKQTTKSVGVVDGDKIKIALKSSKNNDETVSSTLSIGTKSSTFSITTEKSPLNILLENQRYGLNRDIEIRVRDYIKSTYSGDTISCEISGSVPSGLSVDGAECVIKGKSGLANEKGTIKIVAKSQAGNLTVEKSIDIEVGLFKSNVLKTGQIKSYKDGDDGAYSNKLGVPLGYLAQDGYVKDLSTSLEWQDNESKKMSVSEGLDYCINLKAFSGDTGGWRMPTQEELETINNQVAKNYFAKKNDGYYWSNTQFAGNKSNYWYIDYKNGGKSYYLIGTEQNYIRCVRGTKK